MSVNIDDVRHLAVLSKLSLSDDELRSLTSDIDAILGYIDQLNQLDTEGVKPTFQLTGLSNVWREDIIKSQIDRKKLLDLAPEQLGNQVKVPKVL